MTYNQVFQSLQNLGVALQRLMEPFRPLIQSIERVSQALAPVLEAIAPFIENFARYNKFIDLVRRTGWLPYYTVPVDYVEEYGDDIYLLESRLTDFYEKHQEHIRQDIESRLENYRITDQTKGTFREALSAHNAGHYRCVCRVLFPEIDKEFRIHFFNNTAGAISSKKMLEELTNRGPLESFLPREAYGWMLFDLLIDHLYESVNDSNRAKYEGDDVPNRHASIHGLVSCSTFKHSMNMIIMADYIFQVLTSTAKLTSSQQ